MEEQNLHRVLTTDSLKKPTTSVMVDFLEIVVVLEFLWLEKRGFVYFTVVLEYGLTKFVIIQFARLPTLKRHDKDTIDVEWLADNLPD